jgi:DNA-damage-inducible protein J
MPANALVQTRIDADIKARAAAVLAKSGLTLSDAVRILLTRTANEGAMPMDGASSQVEPLGYDAWFRAKVQEALDDPRPPIPNEEVKAYFDARKRQLLANQAAK